jgi:hypothetical protein
MHGRDIYQKPSDMSLQMLQKFVTLSLILMGLQSFEAYYTKHILIYFLLEIEYC